MNIPFTKEGNIQIKVLDKCPCHSGKLFGDCCKDKNYEYLSLGKNFENRDIIFNNTFNITHYDNMANMGMDKIFPYSENGDLSVSNAIVLLEYVYAMVDSGISQFEKYAPCKKGCGHCCSLYLECTAIEAEAIRRHIVKERKEELDILFNRINEMRENLKTVKNSHELNFDERKELYLNYLLKRESCVFLNEEKACSIYNVRPLSCRKFIVFNSSEKCNGTEEIVVPKLAPANIGTLLIDHLSMAVKRYNGLSYEENGEKHSIKRPIIEWFKYGFDDINREK